MNFLVLFDGNGQCQRVARTRSQVELRQFLEAGFIQVDEEEFDRCAALVEETTVRDLGLLAVATGVLTAITTNRQRTPNVNPNRQAFDRLEGNASDELAEHTQSFFRGDIDLDRWQRQMIDTTNATQLGARILGVNGVSNMNQSDMILVSQSQSVQIGYINRFKRQLDDGLISEAEAIRRSRMYGISGGALFEEGITSTLGVPRLPAYPKIRTSCLSNCACRWDILQLAGLNNWDCTWRLAAVEHCPECEQRARTFNPLRIRNGIIQPFPRSGIYT